MDKTIEAEMTVKNRKKTIRIALIILAMLTGTILLLRSLITPSIKRSAINTGMIEKGDIENTINATGEVLPEFEATITSPINASVSNVILDAGHPVKEGESVLSLDKSGSQTELEKLKFQLESKRNDIHRLKLQLDKSFYDIQSNNDIKQLRINSLEADVENARRLYKAGGGTREDIEKTELNLKVAKLEKLQLENEIRNKQQTMQVEMKEAEIAASIQENEQHDLERKLKLANIVASRAGVVTWVNKNIGAAIKEGEPLARIADLGSFKVAGSISDSYIDQLHNGMTAIVRLNETQLRGVVINIYPSVQNGVVAFNIQLNERNNKLLRPNMKADVYLVTASRSSVLRVANGPAFKGAPTQDVFIVAGGKAERRTVHIGMTNFDYVELKDHVNAGEEVILSDMSEYKNTTKIKIQP